MSLKEGIQKFKRIAEGWKNVAFMSEAVEELAKKRAKICSQCEHCVVGKWLQAFLGDEITEIEGMKCDICNCPSSAKTRSVGESCPLPEPKW